MEPRTTNGNHGATILIAEDSPVQAELLRRILTTAGYHVIAAGTGVEALALAGAQQPAAVLSDINMPQMSGYELCRRMRADPALCNTPVILLTRLADTMDVIQGLNAGADCYVTKPYDEKHLLSRLTAMLADPPARDETPLAMHTKIGGAPFEVQAAPTQVLNLLVSTYEGAVMQNRELAAARDELGATAEKLALANAELELRVAKRTAELELARQHEREARERASIERLSGTAPNSATEQAFGVMRLRENAPEFFNALVQRFQKTLEMALEQRVLRVDHPIGAELRALAEQLGAVKAGPRDAIETYVQALHAVSNDVPPQKAQAYAEEGRLLLLELMGNLVSFYRNYFSGSGSVRGATDSGANSKK